MAPLIGSLLSFLELEQLDPDGNRPVISFHRMLL
jgi:hypothetical protein